jgi:hypothetical protein
MNMTTAKLNLLDTMTEALTAARKQPVAKPAPRVRIVPPARAQVRMNASARPLWHTTLEHARDSLAERLLGWTLFVAAAGGLVWLAIMTCQFFLAWNNLVMWMRLAMV